MSLWEIKSLSDLITIKHGYAFKGEYFQDSGGYIVLTPGNFHEHGGFRLRQGKEKFYGGNFPRDYILAKNDLIVAMTEQGEGLLGSTAIVPTSDRFLHNQRLGLIKQKEDVDLDIYFIYYIFNTKHVRQKIRATASGVKVRHTSPSRIGEVEIGVPPIKVQQRIASILSAYDDLIENNTRRIAILEEMARRIYEEWFVHFRFPGHEQVRMVESGLGLIPDGWKVVIVSDAVKRFPSGKKYEQKNVLQTGHIPVLDQGRSGIIGYHNDEPSFLASKEDPVIVFANHTCYQRLIYFPFSAIQNIIPYKSSPYYRRDIFWLYHATLGLVKLNDYKGHWPQFSAQSIIIPDSETSFRFGQNVGPMHLAAYMLALKNANLSTTRDLLLPKLISGELDVSQLLEPETIGIT